MTNPIVTADTPLGQQGDARQDEAISHSSAGLAAEECVIHVGINHLNGKWCVHVMVGACDTAEAAKKLAEEIGPKLGELLTK